VVEQTKGREPRFAPGDRVRIAERPVSGHCRTPFYLRGRPAVVVALHGTFRDPERLAYHRSGLPAQPLYKVRVAQSDLSPAFAAPGDSLEADIYEHWLEPCEQG
jgi:hypothetical protein